MSRPHGSPTPPGGKPRRSGFTLRLDNGRVFVEAVPGDEARVGPLSILELSLEIPEVSFPFDVTGGAERFRSRRCRLSRCTMALDVEAAARALSASLPEEGLLSALELEARHGFLEIAGEVRGAQGASFVARVALEPDGAEVRAVVADLRLHHGAPVPAPVVEAELLALVAAAAGGVAERGSVRLAPLHAALRSFLPARGFKAPDLSGAGVETILVEPRSIVLTFADGAAAAAGTVDPLALSVLEGARAFASAEGLLAGGNLRGARAAYQARGDEATGHRFAATRLLTLLLADPPSFDEALDLSRLLEERLPDLPAATWVRARILEARGDGAGAARLLLALAGRSREEGARTAAILAAEDAGRAALGSEPALSVQALTMVLSLRRDRLPALRLMARAALAASDRQAQLTAWRRLLAYGADDAERAGAHLVLGRLLEGAEARLHLENALRLAPDDREALTALARACQASGDPVRAARALTRAAELARSAGDNREAGQIALAVGELWERDLGHPENALLRYREAAELLPGSVAPLAAAARVARELGRDDEAADHLSMLIAAAGEGAPEAAGAHRELSRLAATAGDLPAAVRHLEASLRGTPALPDLLALAELHARAGDSASRARVLERAGQVAEDPGERGRLFALAGGLLLEGGEVARAVPLLEAALEADPRDRGALEALARAHLATGSPAALDLFERLLALPLDPAGKALALLHVSELTTDPARALLAARQAAGLLPEDPRAIRALVRAERAGGGDELLLALGRLAAADPTSAAAALVERAELCLARGQDQAARADLLRALDADPDTALLGRAGERLLSLAVSGGDVAAPGDVQRARAALELAASRLGDGAPHHLLSALGRASLLAGAEDQAAEAWLLSLRLGGDVPGEELDALLARQGKDAERALALELRARAAAAADGPSEAALLLARAATVHLDLEQPSAAVAALGAAVNLAPRHTEAASWLGTQAGLLRELGDLPGAAAALSQRAGLTGPREAARALFTAAGLHGTQDPKARDASLDGAILRDPSFAPARIARAGLGYSPPRDAEDLTAALSVPPGDPDAPRAEERPDLHAAAARACRAASDDAGQRRHLAILLALRPDDAEAARELSELARRTGDAAALVEILAHRADLEDPSLAVDLLLEAAALSEPEAARELLGRARMRDGRDVRVLDALLPLLQERPAELAAALSDLAGVTTDPARAAELRLGEARARLQAGDRAGAIVSAEAATSLSGDDLAAIDLLLALCEGEPVARARALARKADALSRAGDPGAADALGDLGDALESLGDAAGATTARRRALAAGATGELAIQLRERLAATFEREGRIEDAAVELAEAARQGSPRKRATLHARRAALLLSSSRLTEARAALDAALAQTPRDPALLAEAAQLSRLDGDAAAEADFLEGLLTAGGPGARDEGLRLSALTRESQPARAEAALRRVLALAPGDEEAQASLADLLLDRVERGGEALAEAVALRRATLAGRPAAEVAAVLFELSVAAQAAGDGALCLSLLRDAARAAPERFDLVAALARALALGGAVDEAHAMLKRAVALERGQAPDLRLSLLRLLADVSSERGDGFEAEEALSAILAERPWDEGAARELGRLLSARDPGRAADVLARTAFAMADGERRRALQLELARLALSAGDPTRAGRHLADARRLSPDPVVADLEEAELAREHRQPALAAAALARAAPSSTGEAAIRVHDELARAAREAGDIARALAALDACAALLAQAGRPLEAATRARESAELSASLGDHAAAEAALVRSLLFEPGHAATLRAAAELARARGDAAAEAGHLEGAIAAGKDGPEKARLLLRLAEVCLGPLDDAGRGEHALLTALAQDEHLAAADALLETHLERHQRKGDLASHLHRRARTLPPDQAAPLLSRAAELWEAAGSAGQAAEAALLAAAANPGDAVLARRTAELCEAAGRLDEAARILEEQTARNPHDAGLAARLASLHERRGDLPALARLTERRALLEPAGRRCHALLATARAFEDAGLNGEAKRCEEAAFEDDPADDRAFARVVRRATEPRRIASLLERRARAVPTEAPALHRTRGEVLAREGLEREALAALDDALLLAPDDVAALAARAEIVSAEAGDDAAAETDRRLVLLADGGVAGAAAPAARARYRLAMTAADLGAPDAAELLEKALEARPHDPRSRAAFTALERILADLGPGRRLYEVRLALADRAPDARARTTYLAEAAAVAPDPAARIPLLREIAASDPGARPALLSALRAAGPGSWPELSEELVSSAALGGGPERAALLLEAAHIRAQIGDGEGASNLRQAARETSPEDPAVLRALLPDLRTAGETSPLAVALAALAERTGDPSERQQALLERASELGRAGDPAALTAWQEILSLGPQAAGFAAAAVETRRLLEAEGRTGEVAAVLELQAQGTKGSERAALLASAAAMREKAGDAGGARRDLQAAADAAPEEAMPLLALAEQAEAGGDARGAAEALDEAIGRTADAQARADLRLRRAALLERAGDAAAALAAFRQVTVDRPGDVAAHRVLAAAAQAAGDTEEELPHVRALLARRNELSAQQAADLTGRLAFLSARAGDAAEAAALYESILRDDPADEEAYSYLRSHRASRKAWSELLSLYELRDRTLAAAGPHTRAERRDVRLERARILAFELGRAAEAEEAYRAVLELDGKSRAALAALRELAERRGDHAAAAAALEGELASDPPAAVAASLHLRLGRLREQHLFDPSSAAASFAVACQLAIAPGGPAHLLPEAERGLARAALAAGRPAEALAALERRFQHREDAADPGLRALAAEAAAALGDPAGATLHLEHALEVAPGDGDLLARLEAVARSEGPEALARALSRRSSTAEDPALRAGALLRLADLRRGELGDVAGAEEALKLLLQVDPAHDGAYERLRDLYGAAGRTSDLLDLHRRRARKAMTPADRSGALLAIGDIHRGALPDPRLAADAYERALSVDPSLLGAVEGLSSSYLALGRDAEAEPLLRRLCDEAPSAQALLSLGEVYERSGREEEALDLFERALPHSRQALARVATSLGRLEEALVTLRAELATRAGAPPGELAALHRQVGELERRLLRNAEAARSFEAASALDPDDLESPRKLVSLCSALGDVRRAEAALRTLVSRMPPGPDRALALVELGELRLALSDPPGAIAALENARADRPGSPAALRKLLPLYAAAGRYAELLERAEELKAAAGEAALQPFLLPLARAHRSQGDAGRARELLDSAMARGDGDEDLRTELRDLCLAEGLVQEYALHEAWLAEMETGRDPARAAARLRALAEVCLSRLHDRRSAVSLLERAATLAPPGEEDEARLLSLLAQEPDTAPQAAAQLAERARQRPWDAELLRSLSAVLAVAGDAERARLIASLAEAFAPLPGGRAHPVPADPRGARIGEALLRRLSHPAAAGPLARLIRAMAPVLEPLFPSDLARLGATPADAVTTSHHPVLLAELAAVASCLTDRPISLLVARGRGPEASVENTRPASIVLGEGLLTVLSPSALRFVLARQVALLASGWALVGKFPPGDLLVLCAVACRVFDPDVPVPGLPPERIDPYVQAASRLLPPGPQRELLTGLSAAAREELAGLDPRTLALGLRCSASRAALVVTGDGAGAVEALLRLDRRLAGLDRPGAVAASAELSDLLSFALGEDFAPLRREAGLAR